MRRKIVRISVAIVLLAAVVVGPHLAWRLLPVRTLEVVVLDKSVPFAKYREHAAIHWILHAMKIVNARGEYIEANRDYVGFDPSTKVGRDLSVDHLAKADVLVIADTYGVYRGDYEKPGDIAALERSPKIYGGVTSSEASAIEGFVSRGGLVIAEFNTFASPTEDATRGRLEALFGARWTRWVARYWPNLQDPNEVPKWVGKLYRKVEGRELTFTGGALVFVHEDDDILVLRDGVDLGPAVIEQQRTRVGAELDLPQRGGFWFWMDVVQPLDAEVLHEHVVDATPEGARRLADHGLSTRFPALLKRRNAWYFAGDFVDTALDLGSPERAWVIPYKARLAGCGGGSTADEAFFWGFYAPIAARLFASRAH